MSSLRRKRRRPKPEDKQKIEDKQRNAFAARVNSGKQLTNDDEFFLRRMEKKGYTKWVRKVRQRSRANKSLANIENTIRTELERSRNYMFEAPTSGKAHSVSGLTTMLQQERESRNNISDSIKALRISRRNLDEQSAIPKIGSTQPSVPCFTRDV